MRTLDVLKKARELIATPDRWVKGAMAKNAYGKTVYSYDQSAVCWCSRGAINRAAGFTPGHGDSWCDRESAINAALALDRVVVDYGDDYDVITFNDADDRTHEEVLAAFDKAIELEAANETA